MRASCHDITVFRHAGMQATIPHGHCIIGDNGYAGKPLIISTPNAHDASVLRKFKSRARARHESFNGRLMTFKCLEERFHHSLKYRQRDFEATCVICQYQIVNGFPLFDT